MQSHCPNPSPQLNGKHSRRPKASSIRKGTRKYGMKKSNSGSTAGVGEERTENWTSNGLLKFLRTLVRLNTMFHQSNNTESEQRPITMLQKLLEMSVEHGLQRTRKLRRKMSCEPRRTLHVRPTSKKLWQPLVGARLAWASRCTVVQDASYYSHL